MCTPQWNHTPWTSDNPAEIQGLLDQIEKYLKRKKYSKPTEAKQAREPATVHEASAARSPMRDLALVDARNYFEIASLARCGIGNQLLLPSGHRHYPLPWLSPFPPAALESLRLPKLTL